MNLIPMKVPEVAGLRKTKYAPILREFMEKHIFSAQIEYSAGDIQRKCPSKRAFYKAVRSAVIKSDLPIAVRSRGEEVYIVRTDIPEEGESK